MAFFTAFSPLRGRLPFCVDRKEAKSHWVLAQEECSATPAIPVRRLKLRDVAKLRAATVRRIASFDSLSAFVCACRFCGGVKMVFSPQEHQHLGVRQRADDIRPYGLQEGRRGIGEMGLLQGTAGRKSVYEGRGKSS